MKFKESFPKNQKLTNIIKHYKSVRARKPDTWLDFAVAQPTLKDAIIASALCGNRDNKRHPHQYRIPQAVLEEARDELLLVRSKIKAAKTFHDLFEIISGLDIYGLGPLTRYDIATRIGAFLSLFPDRVYLHAGTKVGAKHLLGRELSEDYILKSDLPKEFRSNLLECWEIEDILCIYKNVFKNNGALRSNKRIC